MCYSQAMGATFTIRLSEDLADALRRESRQSGLPQGEIVRQAITARLRGSRPASAMSRHFGVMRGPADLSTSKAYRRTWGRKTRG